MKTKIVLGGLGGQSQILLGDQDVTKQVSAFTVEASHDRPATMTIYAVPGRDFEFEGDVDVTIASPQAGIVEFLSKVSPATLEQAVLDMQEWGEDRSMFELTIEVLKKLATE